jgi:hypothetical protein
LRHLRDGELAADRGRRRGEGRHAGGERVGNAEPLEPADLLRHRAVEREVAGVEARHVDPRACAATNSASIWSSVTDAVSSAGRRRAIASSAGARSSR